MPYLQNNVPDAVPFLRYYCSTLIVFSYIIPQTVINIKCRKHLGKSALDIFLKGLLVSFIQFYRPHKRE